MTFLVDGCSTNFSCTFRGPIPQTRLMSGVMQQAQYCKKSNPSIHSSVHLDVDGRHKKEEKKEKGTRPKSSESLSILFSVQITRLHTSPRPLTVRFDVIDSSLRQKATPLHCNTMSNQRTRTRGPDGSPIDSPASQVTRRLRNLVYEAWQADTTDFLVLPSCRVAEK